MFWIKEIANSAEKNFYRNLISKNTAKDRILEFAPSAEKNMKKLTQIT